MAKIIFFSPHSLIWVHAFPEAIVAESLMKSGHDIVYITCGESLNSACICLSMMGVQSGSLEVQRVQVCHQCSSRADLIRGQMKLPGYSLSSAAKTQDDEEVTAIMRDLTPANFSELVLENVPIGRIAIYEFLLKRKKMNADLSEGEWREFYPILKSAIKVFLIVKRILDKEKPDYAISYNSLYSVNAVFTYLARQKGVIPYFMHAGLNLSDSLQQLIIGRDSTLSYIKGIVSRWPEIKSMSCNESLLSEVTGHFLELLHGKNVFAYSAPKSKFNIDVRKHFGVFPDQKILVATLSSYDEQFAVEFVGAMLKPEKLLFKTQADWVQVLVEWIKRKPEYFLIIRVHPREFPNKRESVKSQHAEIMQKMFVGLPENVRVNWPEDGLSLYDLACEADAFLNAWSSVGQEMSLLGLPVVIYSKELVLYPVDLNYLGETESQYFDQIEQALKDGWSFERVRKAYRWYAMMFGRSQISIENSYTGPATYKNKILLKFINGLRRLYPLVLEWNDCQKRSVSLECAEVLNKVFIKRADRPFDVVDRGDEIVPSLEQETEYIKIEMARIAKALWGDIEKEEGGGRGKLYQHFYKFLSEEKRTTLS